jgi:hypothetical protein
VNWVSVLAWTAYVAGLGFSLWMVLAILSGRFEIGRVAQGGMTLAISCALVGFFLAYWATPDFNPFVMLGLYLPYFAVAAWSFHLSRLLAAGQEFASAARRALLLAIPSLLLAPLAMGLLVFVLPQ